MTGLSRFAAAAFLALSLSSCQVSPPVSRTPDLAFDALPQIAMNVARIEIVDAYHPPADPKHVEHMFRLPPAAVAHNVIEKQLLANGSSDTLRVTVEDASVVRKELPLKKGFVGFFENGEEEEYRVRVYLKFELLRDDNPGMVAGDAFVSSERTQTILEDASLAERDMILFRLNEQIMQDIRNGVEGTVRKTFGWK
ncbi:MAG TPA: hypothetical protein VEF76_14390 [Patescibacteria group bacterium]|nr:hypothetical protein [Patescibacteria group bacterium]